MSVRIALPRREIPLAARNAWKLTFGEGLEAPSPVPSTIISDGPHRTLRKYDVPPRNADDNDHPVLLIPPLAVPISCFDLRPGQSLAQHLIDTGRTPYVIDYGTIGFADRKLGFEEWIDDIIPAAIARVSQEHGGKPVDLVCWCLGGTMALLSAAAHSDQPIRSIATVATPIDYSKLPNLYPLRTAAKFTGGRVTTLGTMAMGGMPSPFVKLTFRATAFQRELKKPWFIAQNLRNTETLARMEAIERFMAQMPGYPGRLYLQLWKRIMIRNDLAKGQLILGDRRVDLSKVSVPVLAIAGTGDAITSVPAARHLKSVLTNAPSFQFETAPGSHLGVLAGPHASETTWPYIDAFLTEQQKAATSPSDAARVSAN
ncbi:alpha/beta fold hydrolase [Hoyosella rhizosphaerae]|uniref:Hydrolase n=1 Tax=Hoyosella rhizosphaerae TaxID=1755582 RepID=A0A916X9N2_9ACTN|nr:alpha/beta fold hydrolase [Hoyosella rhizosphaerae]MBN4927100.1 alpha/beta fold hydrolase [Hoyosella rhizosphaerae]GGC54039.1 putative hydrolase [Hoyosella rhizosphaerae]